MSSDVLAVVLEALARTWLRRAAKGTILFLPDPELGEVLAASEHLAQLLASPSETTILSQVAILSSLRSFPEKRALNWIQLVLERGRSLTKNEALALGRLVRIKKWYDVLDEVVFYAHGSREDIRPTLRMCLPMLSFSTRWMLGLSSLTKMEKLQMFAVTAAELYPSPALINDLWRRAGVAETLSPNVGFIDGWQSVLVRGDKEEGRGSLIQAIRVMLHDHPSSSDLGFAAAECGLIDPSRN
ncbi:hypothetical protein [Rhizosaccharibacter radicis]|uniref:tRNA nucleotidyltransferase/poly(A) polymerase RNA and SrmB- binding domain-containing protein n=1 Tax=Rhizosaccharibacter radicis TaxID=2782605 RepID=A0ABT1W0U8_9PROT|nr:hypothetical protein [Acetobacteraceae bacterium KSS12]